MSVKRYRHLRARKRRALLLLTVLVAAGMPTLLLRPEKAHAQSPGPNAYMLDWRPGNVHYTTPAVVIEGLGSVNCLYGIFNIIQDTINSVNNLTPTVTEFSPQSVCGSVSQYESDWADLYYIVYASTTNASRYWQGVMLDMEPNYDSLANYQAMEAWLVNQGSNIPAGAAAYLWSEIGGCGGGICYSQAQWNTLDSYNIAAWDAAQVYNSNFAALTNADGNYYRAITTWSGAPAPWNSASYAASAINGAAFFAYLGLNTPYYWENVFQAQ